MAFEEDGKDHMLMIMFDGMREGNRVPIRRTLEEADTNLGFSKNNQSADAHQREFVIQASCATRRGCRGVGSEADVEIMYVKSRQSLQQIKKKARVHYAGFTSSVIYANVSRPSWKTLAQTDANTKHAIFSDSSCPKVCVDSIDPTKHTADYRKKNQLPKDALMCLPLNWWERDSTFYLEVFENFNVLGVIDLFGSANMAIACVESEPPQPYLALLRNQEHVDAIAGHVDNYIMREMGREGPPASKFFLAEVKSVVARLFPALPTDAGVTEEDCDYDEASKMGGAKLGN